MKYRAVIASILITCGFTIAQRPRVTNAAASTRPVSRPSVDPETRARELAWSEYVRLGNRVPSPAEKISRVSPVRMGYEVNGFARTGDTLWEVLIDEDGRNGRQIAGILWVNLQTGRVYAVIGIWR
jgi:hypothetical protein